jgi:phage-related protein
MDEAGILSGLQSISNGLNTVSSDLKVLVKELKTATAVGQKSTPASSQNNIDIKELNEVIKSLIKNSNNDSLYKFLQDTSKTLNKKGDLFELIEKYIGKPKTTSDKTKKSETKTDIGSDVPEIFKKLNNTLLKLTNVITDRTKKSETKTDIGSDVPEIFKKLNNTLLKLTNVITKIKPSTEPVRTGFLSSLGQFVKDLNTTTAVTRNEEVKTKKSETKTDIGSGIPEIFKKLNSTLSGIPVIFKKLNNTLLKLTNVITDRTKKSETKTDIGSDVPEIFKKLNNTLLKLTNVITKIKPSTEPVRTGFLSSLGQFVKDLNTTTAVTRNEDTATDKALKEETIQKVSVTEIAPNVLKQLKEVFGEKTGKTADVAKKENISTASIKKQYEAMGKNIAKGITAVTRAASKGIDIVAKSASKSMSAIGRGLTSLGKGAGAGFSALGKGIASMIKSIGSAIPGLAVKLATLANPATLIGLTALSLAILAIGTALRIATPALKVLADLIQNVVIKVLEVFRDIIIKIGDVYKEVFIEGLKQAANIITAIGGAISKVISTIAEGITKIVDKVVSGIQRLAKINPLKLYAVAGGIIAISAALATFAVGQAVAGLGNFASGLLGKITGQKGPIETIIELGDKSGSIKAAADGIKQISSSLQGLNKVNFKYIASGIVLVAKAIATLTKGTGGNFISGILGKITGQKGPLETLLQIANKSDNIKAAGDAIVGISNAFRTFKYIDFDTIAEGITKILKATQSQFSVGGFLNKITGQKNPLELLISFSKSANLLDKAATAVEKMSAAFANFNNINIEKIKELTNLPLGKLAAAAILGSMLSTSAPAQDQPTASVETTSSLITSANKETYDPTKIVKNKVESREGEDFDSTGSKSRIMSGMRISPISPDRDIVGTGIYKDKTNTDPFENEPEKKTNEINKISPVMDQKPTELFEDSSAIDSNEKIISKLDELILALRRPTVNSAATTLTTGESTAIDNSSVNIFNSGSDRDIPYVERNKYRQQLLYIRGIL